MNLRSILMNLLGWVALPLILVALAMLSVAPHLLPIVWREASFAWGLAPFLLGAAALLGLIFRQLRITLMTIVVGAVVWGVRFFPAGTPSGLLLAYLAGLVVPIAAVFFLLIPEQRFFSEWGIARFSVAVFFAGMLLMVPRLHRVQDWFWEHPIPSLLPGLNVPLLTVLSLGLLVAAGVVLARPESPNVGRFFFATSLHVVALVNAAAIASMATLPARELEHAFCLTSAILLVWLSIDCGWRNAFIDELTQLPGRRPLRHHFASLGHDFTIASLDIDHFKRINDTYGHDVGDQVLRSIASQLRGFREGTVYRSGGEEFVIVMKRGDPKEHAQMLDALREQIASRPFILRGIDRPRKRPSQSAARPAKRSGKQVQITVSIGVADSEDNDVPDEVLMAADKALYTAKRNGRNRVSTA